MINIVHSHYFLPIIFMLVCWTVPWKGVALWRAARRKDMWWFVALLIINSFAVLEIVYIFVFSKRKQECDSTENREVPDDAKIPKLKLFVLGAIIVFIVILGMGQWSYLRNAHSTFEHYYAFRGCTELIKRTDDAGWCKTNSGATIKIVAYQNKWYLDGDLPWACVHGVCFGW